MANKELKTLLYMCAWTSIKYYPEFRTHYDRKTKDGKIEMGVSNAIKNKIILRALAVIKNKQPYVNNHETAA